MRLTADRMLGVARATSYIDESGAGRAITIGIGVMVAHEDIVYACPLYVALTDQQTRKLIVDLAEELPDPEPESARRKWWHR